MQRVSSISPLATFRLDVEYTRIAPAFTAAGIGTILLKGPAFDQLLFGGTRSRAYSDIDLLADPVAADALGSQGREHVRENFLSTRELADWLRLFGALRK